MKNIILICVFCSTFLFGQKKIGSNDTNFISVNFPTNVESVKISQPDIIDVQQEQDNIYIQYLTTEGTDKPANLLVKTQDGYYYSMIVFFEPEPKTFNYFFHYTDSLRKVTPNKTTDTAIVGDETKNDKKSTKKSNESESLSANTSPYEETAQRLLKDKGYIKIRNIVKNKKMELIHKGIWYENNKLYFLFEINNLSGIPFSVESYKFEIIGTETENSSSSAQLIVPTSIYNKHSTINANSMNKTLFVFEPFTISDGKVFKVSINEKNGDRNLVYDINSKTFSETKIKK